MLLDLSDPGSIAAWVRIRPREHWAQLKVMVRLQPKWRDAARRAGDTLRAAPGARDPAPRPPDFF